MSAANPIPFLLGAALLSWLGTWLVRRALLRVGMLDQPNERSMHKVPTPRGGGLAIALTFMVGMAVLLLEGAIPRSFAWTLLIGGGAVAALGLIDDRVGLPNAIRLTGWFAIAIGSVWETGGLGMIRIEGRSFTLGLIGDAIAVIGIVWMINLYNFMDGIDGLAASEAVVGSGAAALILGIASGKGGPPMETALLAAAAGGFLFWNWPPARIFMGDVGSGFLGFVFAVFAIQTNQDGTLSVAVWAILLSVFLVDATFTVAWRLRRGERVYEAHRRHAYQQAARDLGRHRPVTAAVVVLDAILAAVAAVAQAEPRAEIPLLIAASAAMAGLWWYWAIRIPSERAAGRAAPRQPPA